MRSWIKYLILALVVGIIFGGKPIYVYIYALTLTLLINQAWIQIVLLHLVVKRTTKDNGYFVGESIPVSVEVSNPSLLPVLWLYIEATVPLGLLGQEKRIVLSMAGKTRQSVTYSLKAYKRGIFVFSPVRVLSGDILGLFHYKKESDSIFEIVVYPRYKRIIVESVGFLGATVHQKTHISLSTDPLNICGIRDYHRGDPINQIDWKATARTFTLKTRQNEYRNTLSFVILLNGDLKDYNISGASSHSAFEKAIEMAASLAKWILDYKGEVGLFTNGQHQIYVQERHLPVLGVSAKSGKEQFVNVLSILAAVNVGNSYSFSHLIGRVDKHLFLGTALVIVSPSIDENLWLKLAQKRSRGIKIIIVFTNRIRRAEREEILYKAYTLGVQCFIVNEKEGVESFVLNKL